MKNVEIFEIEKINFDGKWVEFWFKGLGENLHSWYHRCCKTYMLDKVDETPKGYVDNHGYVGLYVVWVQGEDRPRALIKDDEYAKDLKK